MSDFERGILYIATGPSFVAEAVQSAQSVKAVWPEIPLALITDVAPEADCFAHIDIIPARRNSSDKPRYIGKSPFARTVFLDADTYCCAPFPEVFDLLDRFDIAAAYDDGRFTERTDPATGKPHFIKVPGIPDCFPELNGGVIAYRRSPAVDALFARWATEYEESCDGPLLDHREQPSLRAALYNSEARLGVLPSEYNFRLVCPGFARNAIKIIHGRWTYEPIRATAADTLQAIDRAFNANHGPRVFVPSLGMIYGHGPYAHLPREPERAAKLIVAP